MEQDDNEYYNIREEDIKEEVKFEIDKNSFKGPFTCHGKKTKLIQKKISWHGLEITYKSWYCTRCKKEYLDADQGRKLEKFWILRDLLDDKMISVERTMNFDGKTFFFRFPKEMAQKYRKGDVADIKLLRPDGRLMVVEIKRRQSQD